MKKLSETEFEMALDRVEAEPDSSAALILKCAEELFSNKGFEAVTTRDIAKASGKNISTLHFHWLNKRTLYEAVCRIHSRQLLFFVTETETAIADSGLESTQAVEQWVDKTLDLLINNPTIAKLAWQSLSAQTKADIPTLFEHDLQVFARFQEYLSTLLGATDAKIGQLRLYTLFYFVVGIFVDSPLQQVTLGGSIYEQPELQQTLKVFAKQLTLGLLQKETAM